MKHGLIVVLLTTAVALLGATAAQASCHAQVNCQVTIIFCDGQSVCESGSNWVRCDGGETIYCPICQAQTTCCDGRFLYCNGYVSCEESPGRYVKCDGQIQGICPRCQSSLENPILPFAPGGGWFAGLLLPELGQGVGCVR
jgi:hypothetical protein